MSSTLRVAVTGGSGQVGLLVVKELVARGHQVINLDRRQASEPVARFVYADLTRREQVQPVLEQVDALVHLAEISNQYAPYSPDEIFAHNTRAASTVLQVAADLKLKRAIYTSSCQVYGSWDWPRVPPARLPFDETLPVQPQNCYALSKVANEGYAQYIAKHHGLSVAVFRLPWVLTWEWDERHWKWFEHRGAHGEGMATYVSGADVAKAYALALENPRPGCEVYQFSAPEILSMRPLRDLLTQEYPGFPLPPEDWPAFRSPVLTDKAREHFGWQPQVNMLDQYRQKFGREPG